MATTTTQNLSAPNTTHTADERQAAVQPERWQNPVYENVMRHSLFNYAALARPAATLPTMAATANVIQPTTSSGASPALKIGITADGLYRLLFADLQNAGLDPTTFDPRTLKLYQQGIEQAIHVDGEEDGRFDPGDAILFYGAAIHDVYTAQNIYWLTTGGEPGRRMEQRSGAPTGIANVPPSFPVTYHAEQDTAYWQTMPGGEEDRWFWDKRLSPTTEGMPVARTYPLTLQTIAANGPPTLRVRLKGYTNLTHRTRISINGHRVDDQAWRGQVQFTHVASFPATFLHSGENDVIVETVDTGAAVDQVLVNWIEVDYAAQYVVANDQLAFGVPDAGPQQFTIGRFTNNELWVVDITEPGSPVLLTNFAVEPAGSGYTIKVQESAQQPNHRYLALTTAQLQHPVTLVLDQPTTWKSPTNGADYIIITHEDFYPSALTLAKHRQAQGLRVAVVQVGDIYDEFNGGIFNPQAIRDFLAYAYQNWQPPAPLYVVLLGDANQDFKDNLQTNTRTYVPSQTIRSELFGEVSSDQWFATVSGNDPLPDLLVGRLSAQTPQEADAIITKLIQYDQSPLDEAWHRSVLFVADDDEARFGEISTELAASLPFYYTVQRVDAGNYPPGDPTTEIVNRINGGAVLVNYVGHGEYFGWGEWDQNQHTLFINDDVGRLNNANRLPVITVANCLNVFFAGPQNNPALAEVLQRRVNGGAIAVWAPTSLEYPTGHSLLMHEFYQAIFAGDQTTLGAATVAASVATLGQSNFWQELVATYALFGDPATRLHIPTNYPYVQQTTPAQGATDIALDQPIQVVFNKPMNPATVSLSSNTADLTFLPTWNADKTVLNLSSSGFRHGNAYTLTLYGQDRQGNALGPGVALNPWSFTATTDDIPPQATIHAWGDNPSAILIPAILDVTFSEPVRPESVTYTLNEPGAASIYWPKPGQTMRVVYDHLQVGQSYTFSLLTAKDSAGNLLQAPIQESFTVTQTRYTYLPLVTQANSGGR